MNDQPNNPPAFPKPTPDGDAPQKGMTLLDHFATKAMQGMLSHSTRYKPRPGASDNWHEAISEEAYQIAQAMLSERSKHVK